MNSPLDFLIEPMLNSSRQRQVFGVVTAKVVRIGDGGEYFLHFFSLGEDVDSHPARVMAPMAGDQRGMHFFPEVGDEVVVAFENGDTTWPIIIGALWNRDTQPPDQAHEGASNDIRTIVTRSGHELTFDDTPGAEKILLKTQGGHQVLLDDAPGAGKVEVRTTGGHSLLMDDTPPGKVELKDSSGCSVKLDSAGGMMTLQAPAMLTIKSQIIAIEGTAITLKTTGSVSASMVTIDGKPFGLHMHLAAPIGPSGPVMP